MGLGLWGWGWCLLGLLLRSEIGNGTSGVDGSFFFGSIPSIG